MKRAPALVRLSWDHHHGLVKALRLERELPGAGADQVEEIYSDLIRFWSAGLLPHFHGESDCLLARLLRHVEPEDPLIQKTTGDHLAMAALVARMRDAGPDAERRRGLLAEFGAILRAHIRWEEATLFERVQELLSVQEMEQLGSELDEVLPDLEAAPRAG